MGKCKRSGVEVEHGVKLGNGSGHFKGRRLGHQYTCFWATSESLDELSWSCIFKLVLDISCVDETGPCVLCYVGNLDFAFEMLFHFSCPCSAIGCYPQAPLCPGQHTQVAARDTEKLLHQNRAEEQEKPRNTRQRPWEDEIGRAG